MNTIEKSFEYGVQNVRVFGTSDDPEFVAADVAAILGYRMASDMTRSLDASDTGTRLVRTPSGEQRLTVLSEGGLYQCIMQRQTGRMSEEQASWVRGFQRKVTHEILPEIRKTGSYGAQAPAELTRRDLARMVLEAEDAREAAEQRAVAAESFKEHIELNAGLTVRDFHKKYFSEHRETEVNEFFYARGLLLDERGKRYIPETGERKNGKNHRRPTFQGKPFFYLHSKLDRDKVRREETRVRPGEPELALVEYMVKRGFTANKNESKELAHV